LILKLTIYGEKVNIEYSSCITVKVACILKFTFHLLRRNMTSLTRCIKALIGLLLTIIATQSQVTQAVRYELLRGVRHKHASGGNIGKCGRYRTRALLQAACTSNPRCVGYSTRTSTFFDRLRYVTVGEDGFYPWCLKSSDLGRSKDKSHNFYLKVFPTRSPTMAPTTSLTMAPTIIPTLFPTRSPTLPPTTSPLTMAPSIILTLVETPQPTTAPTRRCLEKQIWTRKIALENCPAKICHKTFGVKACKSSYQKRLVLSLANKLYRYCRSKCVYDYDTIIAGGNGAFRYTRRAGCYSYVTKGRCVKRKKKYEAIVKRAKELC
jgi:hypothetical protein